MDSNTEDKTVNNDSGGLLSIGHWFYIAIISIVTNWVIIGVLQLRPNEHLAIYPHHLTFSALIFYSFAQPVAKLLGFNLFVLLITMLFLHKKVHSGYFILAMIMGALVGGLAIWGFEDNYHYYVGLSNIVYGTIGFTIGWRRVTRFKVVLLIIIIGLNFILWAHNLQEQTWWNHSKSVFTAIGHTGALLGGIMASGFAELVEEEEKKASQSIKEPLNPQNREVNAKTD